MDGGATASTTDYEARAAEFDDAYCRIRRTLRRVTRREVGLAILPEAQRELLRLVDERPGVTVGGAAEILQVADNTVSTLVRQLVTAGYLERVRDPLNRRVVHLELTAPAYERFARFHDTRTDVLLRALASLDHDSRQAIDHAVPALRELATKIEGLRQ